MAVVLLVFALPTGGVRLAYGRSLYEWGRKVTADERRAWYYSWILSRDTYAKEIRLFGLGLFFRRLFRDLRAKIRRDKIRLSLRFVIRDATVQTGIALVTYCTYLYIGYRAIHGRITIGDLVMYFQALQRGTSRPTDVGKPCRPLRKQPLHGQFLRVPRPLPSGDRSRVSPAHAAAPALRGRLRGRRLPLRRIGEGRASRCEPYDRTWRSCCPRGGEWFRQDDRVEALVQTV